MRQFIENMRQNYELISVEMGHNRAPWFAIITPKNEANRTKGDVANLWERCSKPLGEGPWNTDAKDIGYIYVVSWMIGLVQTEKDVNNGG